MESNLDDLNLSQRFSFNTREFVSVPANSTVVGIGASVLVNSSVLTVPIAINEAIRIVRMSAVWLIFAGSVKDITYADLMISMFLTSGPGNQVESWPGQNSPPGGGVGNQGLAMLVEDEIIYGTDYSGQGFAAPSVNFFASMDAFGGAASHSIAVNLRALIERYSLKTTAPLRG